MDAPAVIKVLVVDDSSVLRALLVHLLELDPVLHVVATVADGAAALDYVRNRRPDVVLMDIHMPGMDGFETTRCIMETCPVPIVICTATASLDDATFTFRMMEAGAVACVQKPVGPEHPGYERMAGEIRQTVRLMSEVKVVRRRLQDRSGSASPLPPPAVSGRNGVRVVGIGASTGGPLAVQAILAALPKDFPVPILLVQHIAQGFLAGLADWLNQTTGLRTHIAAHAAEPLPGHVYVAPDNFHLGMAAGGRLALSKDQPENGLRPAVSHLFRSLAENVGADAVGVLLTGMGTDGAAELCLMRDRGAVTLAQDRESSVVHGMPGEAIRLGGAVHILPPAQIAAMLDALVARPRPPLP